MERTFRHIAEDKGLSFTIAIDPNLPTAISTDAQRLEQVLKNLLSNAFKFTERGYVNLRVGPATDGWSEENQSLSRAPSVLAFSVSDSGIGIAVRQAGDDLRGRSSRPTAARAASMAAPVSASRSAANWRACSAAKFTIESKEGRGSTFTLFLPQNFTATPAKLQVVPPSVAAKEDEPQRRHAGADGDAGGVRGQR